MSQTPSPQSVPEAEPISGSNLPVELGGGASHARRMGWRYVNLDAESATIDPGVLSLLEARVARQYNVVPVEVRDGREVHVASETPDDYALRSVLSPLFDGLTLRFVYAEGPAIRRRIEQVYSARSEAAQVAGVTPKRRRETHTGGALGRIESSDEGDNPRLLRLIIEQALRDKASDIHFEPIEGGLAVRSRVDGKLRLLDVYSAARAEGIVSLIKVQAKMRSDKQFTPDSGVISFEPGSGAKAIDIRVETTPTAWGQSAVMRLQSDIWRELSGLGFSETNERRFRDAIAQPFGIVLATGPTGSGKSTTLYSALRERIDPELKIVTLENPIEYKAPEGLTQISINEAQGMTFASGLRSTLRQDPDIVLVGEIRDRETAETAVDAAMTGHLLLSTLHTNSAVGALPRLTRMGIEPILVADSMLAVVGQRLVRRLCPACRVPTEPDVDACVAWGFDADRLNGQVFEPRPDGCNDCHGIGWAGRIPIHEVMLVSSEMAEAISMEVQPSVLERLAREAGMTSMREDGFDKALAGLTTISEVNARTRRSLT